MAVFWFSMSRTPTTAAWAPIVVWVFPVFLGDGTTMASIFRYKNNKSFAAQFFAEKNCKLAKWLNDCCNFKLPSKTVSYKKTTAIMVNGSFGSSQPPLNRNQPSCWTWTLDARHWPWQLRSTQEVVAPCQKWKRSEKEAFQERKYSIHNWPSLRVQKENTFQTIIFQSFCC